MTPSIEPASPRAGSSRVRGWAKSIVDLALIVLIIVIARSAIAEPYYVPSGSMEPTLKIGDELLATKYPYGYSMASLPLLINIPSTQRILGALPHSGDVVVFRAPANPSQIWVKRVIGLPGDRIAMHHGRLWINGKPVGLTPDGLGRDQSEDGARRPVPQFIETLPGRRQHLIFQESTRGPMN
ncbi:MAG: signal peptidase I, partial [Pseudomonadota bacterium]